MIPSRDECFLLLKKYNFPESKRKHIELVAKVAQYLAREIEKKISKQKLGKNKIINLDLVYAGGMLHDIDKGIPGAGEVHPKKAVEILFHEGYPEVAKICETHTINAFLDPRTVPSTWEEKCVALADKMVKDEIIGVRERFRLWNEEDLPEAQKEVLKKSYSSVKELEKEVLGIIGLEPEEIREFVSC